MNSGETEKPQLWAKRDVDAVDNVDDAGGGGGPLLLINSRKAPTATEIMQRKSQRAKGRIRNGRSVIVASSSASSLYPDLSSRETVR